ncbi:TIGR03085 family metal-binding protein [Antrihabitans stalactiti]|uniref:TIGR03085 family protein n=1 Tax=Antrihabitans stalactiti TaxID=2584121 RepID=A0A848KA70_9NOCA|nr:TIGR03085 family metal-binding protein [Antrihabitans stalactiti]NMN94154.1 TIGR03085 family protein [Antrihabitans stalactiti]
MSFAQRERHELVASMAEKGPNAPTLCGQWTVRDLAAHLVVRERRPDASPGIMISQLAGYTESVRSKAAQRSLADLLEDVSTGPPIWSPLRPFDALVNTTEMFIHHEDVRRGSPGWEPRTLADADEAKLWAACKQMARRAYRKSPVTVVLATPDGKRATVRSKGDRQVVLTGKPSELLLHAFGRNEVRLEASGTAADVDAVMQLDRSV